MRCPTCGGSYMPSELEEARTHYTSLPEKEQEAIAQILLGHVLYSGKDLGRGWSGVLHSVLSALSQPVTEALDKHGVDATRAALGLNLDEDEDEDVTTPPAPAGGAL